MRAILNQRDEADLRKALLFAVQTRPVQGLVILRVVGDIQRASIKTDRKFG